MTAQKTLRATFNQNTENYNRFRPHYPAELFIKLIHDCQLSDQSKLLEIGPGTGQATLPLAALGCDITAVELGADLADKAREVLIDFKNVKIITGAFEEVELPANHFDLIYSATAFHWINPEVKFTKTASLLKPGGCLAIIHTEHASDEIGDDFFKASQSVYGRYFPHKPPDFYPPKISELKPPEINNSIFELQSFTTFPITISYTAKDYAGLLSTYSPIISLPDDRHQGFLNSIESLIDSLFGGSIDKHFAMTLTIAKRKD